MQAIASRLGLLLQPVEARSPSEVISAVDAAARSGADAIVLLSLLLGGASAAISARLPAIFSRPDAAGQHGVLFALGVDTTPMHRRAATYVDKILKGARATDIPVEQPSAIELVVNLQTARVLGITVPESVLSQATTIIQ